LTEICKSSNNSDDDGDDTYFPTVQELIAGQGMSRGHAPKAVNKPALDNGDRSINPDEFILGPNLGSSQGIWRHCFRSRSAANQFTDRLILVGEDEQADLSDFHAESTKSIASCSESRQTSLDTTISSSSKSQNSEVDCKVSTAAELCEKVSSSLKCKTRSIWGGDVGKLSYSLIAIHVSNYSTGDLSEGQDGSTDSNSDDSDSDDDSEIESKFDNRPAQKKQKTDNSQHSRKGKSTCQQE
jgi:hypothetical protein